MKKARYLFGVAVVILAFSSSGVASADSPNTGCRDGWVQGAAVSPDAVKRDRNGDGIVCAKFVNGQGNGDYIQPNAVVTDNNTPPAAG
jgi:hypothetical protein